MRRDCSLVQLEDMLDRNLFIRISKSGIVNLMNVDSYKKGTINKYGMLRLDYLKQHKKALYTTLLMKDELTNHLVSVRRRKDFEIAFQRYDLEFRGE